MSTLARLVLLYCMGALVSASAATFTFRFNDGVGVGFNDPTPFIPIGGNQATTLGEARKNVLIEAGRIWGALLISNVPIVVDAVFSPQPCDATTGTLASAGARTFFRDFADGFSVDTFFASALADSLAGEDLMLQTQNPNNPDIRATFNLSVDSDSACLGGRGFYYGLDHNKGNRIDTLIVALHELAHGFGFASEIDTGTGVGFTDGRFSSFVLQIFDEQLGRTWPMLSAAERVTSAVGNPGLAWNGSSVNAQVGLFSIGATSQGRLRLFAPTPVSDGSSVSHWDRSVTPNILMEPNLSNSLITNSVDVTVCALRDIGWQTTRCPDSAARGATPVATSQSVTVLEDTPVTITLAATDAEMDPLVFNISTLPLKGSVSGNTATRTYTPTANANGADSFSFTASDGGTASSPATVTITITPVNDPPVAANLVLPVFSGQASPFTLSGLDVDGDTLTFELVTNPSSGTLTGTGAAQTYQSNTGFVGADSFTYRVRDATTVSATATVMITVAAVTPPVTSTPVPGGRGGGGGSMNELWLLALAVLALAARLGKSSLPRHAAG